MRARSLKTAMVQGVAEMVAGVRAEVIQAVDVGVTAEECIAVVG